MNILLVPSAYYPSLGGVEEVVRQLSKELIKRNHKVQIVTTCMPNTHRKSIVDGVRVNRFRFYLPARTWWQIIRFIVFFPLELCRLIYICVTFKPNIINVHCASGNLLFATVVANVLNIPLIVSTHGETLMDASNLYQTSAFIRWVFKWGLRKAVHVTACSQATLTEVNTTYVNIENKSTVVYNGIDPEEFNDISNKQATPSIFAAGRLTQNKGFDLLIEAFSRIKHELKDYHLIIAGDGEERQNLKNQIQQAQLENSITLTGRLERKELVEQMINSRFIVMPSRYEPFGIVALEALAAGKAVIASIHGGTQEFIKQGEHGLLVDPLNIQELSNALIRMSETYQQLERNNREYAKRFTWDQVADKFIALYSSEA